ncbi:hypothetical protein [uncultured Algibacter sp.]|uniref:hypothetical protein n=1 Tax=uncultured Algibacter sp. TaxID=298659 RepID=UPI003216CD35
MRLIIKLFRKIKNMFTSIIDMFKIFNQNKEHNVQFQKVKKDKKKGVDSDLNPNEFFQKFMKENYGGNV